MIRELSRGITLVFLITALACASLAQDVEKIGKLALEVQRAEDLRAVKNLQVSYSQYSQFGLWSQMAALFAENGEAIYGTDELKGRAAIAAYYLSKWGSGREGLAPGGVRAQFDDTPVVNLSADGQSAKGQWHEIALIGQLGAGDDTPGWGIGAMENEYVKESGVWKISVLHYYPYAAGSYAAGWKTTGTVPFLPFHYTPETAGIAVPPIPADRQIRPIHGSVPQALVAINKRIAALNSEDAVRNLQNAYGYYVDRKMWDDAADLFTRDAVLEESDTGIYSGVKSIRHSFERFGPQGLKRGQLNDHPLFDLSVTISPKGTEARVRGMEFRELGDVDSGTASLGLGTFDNRFVKGADGIWRIREMRIFPLAITDYYKGWNKSRLDPTPASGRFAPDKRVPEADKASGMIIPAFFQNHPVTGKPVALPKGAKVVATQPLLPEFKSDSGTPSATKVSEASIADTEHRLQRSIAYDDVDNLTHAFGAYIMDNRFEEEAALYAEDGWRGKFQVGFCQGPAQIERCESTWPGGKPLPHPRTNWQGRLLLQPVILISEDGLSARIRTRLHSFRVNDREAGVLSGAMYPNNQAKVVNGAWKIDAISVEEPYWSSTTYADGWARTKVPPPPTKAPIAPGAPPRVQPSIDRPVALKIRFWGIDMHPDGNDELLWPNIKPMWFSYKNPVTDREPPNYCPNLKTCERDLEAKGHKPVQ